MADFETDSTVFGYFSSETQAESAVRELYAAGFTRTQISVAGSPGTYSSGTGASTTGSKMREEGHKAGEAVGGFWERIKEFFEGDSAEPYADERTRGDLASNEVTSSSDVYDYDPEEFHQTWGGRERSRYFNQQYGHSGDGYILSVNASDRRAEAESILEANGADLGRNAAAAQYTGSSTPAADLTGNTAAYSDTADAAGTTSADRESPRRIQLYGEVLRVHRDRIQSGEARIRKETITETQNVQVPVTREELVVERIPVSGQQAAPGATIGSENEEIRVPLSEERARIEKEPVLREQVNIGKRAVTDNETREETLRREELRVENQSDTNLDTDEDRFRKAS